MSVPDLQLGPRFDRLWRAVSTSGPWARRRAAVVAGWAALSLLSILLATGGRPAAARVFVVDTGFGTAVDVQNRSDRLWQDVTVVLEPGGYVYRRSTLRPGERMTLHVGDFEAASGDATRPAGDYRPARVTVHTAGGAWAVEIRG